MPRKTTPAVTLAFVPDQAELTRITNALIEQYTQAVQRARNCLHSPLVTHAQYRQAMLDLRYAHTKLTEHHNELVRKELHGPRINATAAALHTFTELTLNVLSRLGFLANQVAECEVNSLRVEAFARYEQVLHLLAPYADVQPLPHKHLTPESVLKQELALHLQASAMQPLPNELGYWHLQAASHLHELLDLHRPFAQMPALQQARAESQVAAAGFQKNHQMSVARFTRVCEALPPGFPVDQETDNVLKTLMQSRGETLAKAQEYAKTSKLATCAVICHETAQQLHTLLERTVNRLAHEPQPTAPLAAPEQPPTPSKKRRSSPSYASDTSTDSAPDTTPKLRGRPRKLAARPRSPAQRLDPVLRPGW